MKRTGFHISYGSLVTREKGLIATVSLLHVCNGYSENKYFKSYVLSFE